MKSTAYKAFYFALTFLGFTIVSLMSCVPENNLERPNTVFTLGDEMKFPTVQGSNLLRQKKTLPQDFEGALNLVFVPFLQWQQSEVDSWVPWIQEMESTYPEFLYYELPTIENRNRLFQTFINEGMRAGIPNPLTRERTITLYLDKTEFQKALGLPDEDHIYILLLNSDAAVIHRFRGTFTATAGDELEKAIKSNLGSKNKK